MMPKQFTFTQNSLGQYNKAKGNYVVYMLHFTVPVARKSTGVRHYVGLTKDIESRMRQHLTSRGSGLVRAAASVSKIVIARIWRQDGHFEQRLKQSRHFGRLCPICIEKRRLYDTSNTKKNPLHKKRVGSPRNVGQTVSV